MKSLAYSNTPVVEWKDERLPVQILVKLECFNHPLVSGNKWWKLKYNLEEALRQGYNTLLTFGGPYSNHIFATAAAAAELGFNSIGIIRGEEVNNPTMTFARSKGMQLHFISRDDYRRQSDPAFSESLEKRFGKFFLIPEGGTNEFAIKGCIELGSKLQSEIDFDFLCLPVGTGGTIGGLVSAMDAKKHVIGFASLKGAGFLHDHVKTMARLSTCDWHIELDYHFGGYAKRTEALDDFISRTKADHQIELDPVYTAKMMYGVIDLVNKGYFPRGSTVLALHTGGLQGGLYS